MHISVSYHVGKVQKCMKVSLKWAPFNALGRTYFAIELLDTRLGGVPKGMSPGLGGGVNVFCYIVSRWQGVKFAKDGLNLLVLNVLGQ